MREMLIMSYYSGVDRESTGGRQGEGALMTLSDIIVYE